MASSAEVARSLEDRTAVVTGGSRGIGAAVVDRLSRAGARVHAVARGAEALDRVCGRTGALAVCADAASEAGIEAIENGLGGAPPDIVVHSAGAFTLAAVADTSVEDFDRMMAVNVRAAFLMARRWLPGMTARGSGHFVSIGSVAGRLALPGNAAYSASKFGLRGLHAVLEVELRGTGVVSTLLEPAATATSLWEEVDADAWGIPPREAMLEADAVADAVLWTLTRPAGVSVPNLMIGRG